jgi:hypothetical protein
MPAATTLATCSAWYGVGECTGILHFVSHSERKQVSLLHTKGSQMRPISKGLAWEGRTSWVRLTLMRLSLHV